MTLLDLLIHIIDLYLDLTFCHKVGGRCMSRMTNTMDWHNARRACRRVGEGDGGQMAVIVDGNDQDDVRKILT